MIIEIREEFVKRYISCCESKKNIQISWRMIVLRQKDKCKISIFFSVICMEVLRCCIYNVDKGMKVTKFCRNQ